MNSEKAEEATYFLLPAVVSGDVEDVQADEESGGEDADTEQHIAVHQGEGGLVVHLVLLTVLLSILTSNVPALYNHRN